MGELLIRGAIWASLLAWGAAEWLRLGAPRAAPPRQARAAWTAGGAFAAVHVAAGFHFRHGWSHEAAFQDTARQTEAVLGVAFGGGLWFNYAFLAIWAADAAWWWVRPAGFAARPAALDRAVRGYVAFIFVNGALVFPHGLVRLLGTAVLLALAVAWYRGRGARGALA
jgi:hypothetical protein